MLDVLPSRLRPLTLLAAVLVAQVLLLAMRVTNKQDVPLIREWTVTLMTPVQEAGAYLMDKTRGVWQGYVDLRGARSENEKLRADLNALKVRAAQLESQAAEATRLTTLLQFRDTYPQSPMLAARVISASAVGSSKIVYLNRGEQDGVKKDMGVITPDGVVGKVLGVYQDTCQVLLLTDKESGVGALLAGSRTHGVLRGSERMGDDPYMDYVINDEKVPTGERVLTSGKDRIFPRDLPVGTVVETAAGNPFQRIRVRPAARLDRLEEVLILLTRQEMAPAQPLPVPNPAPVKTADPVPPPQS
jgi:rod shape-determining protein MreC